MSRRLKILNFMKLSVLAALSFLLLILLLISALLFTHSGNQLAISIAEQIEPRLSIELEQGSFLNSPTFSKISWLDQQAEIRIESVRYRFDWSCLFKKVCLQRLDISNAQFIIESSDTETDKTTEETDSSVFEFPIEVSIQAINLNKIHFSINDLTVDLNTLHLQADAKKKKLTLKSIIDGLSVKLPRAVVTESVRDKKIPDSIPALLSQQDLPEIILPFNLYVDPLKVTDFTLNQGEDTLLTVNSLTSQFNFLDAQLAIQNLVLDLPETDLQLVGKINFTGKYPLDMQLEGQLKSIKQLQPAELLTGQIYDLKSTGDLSQLKTELLLSNKLSLQLTAQIDLFQKNLPHSLTLNWQRLRWPLTGTAQYSSAAGSLQSRGAINDYQVKLKSDYNVENIPAGKLRLDGQGNLQQLNLKQLLVNTLDGTATLSGLLNWQDAIKWDGQLAIDKIDLEELDTQYTGNFSGLIKQNIQVFRNQKKEVSWQFNIPDMDINGQFLKRPFAVNGVLSGDNEKGISFQNVTINNAENEFIINGLLATQNDLAIKLNITDLSHALLDSSGKIHGELKIQGPKNSLNVKSNLQGELLSYQTTKLGSIQLEGETLIADKSTLALQLTAKKLTIAEQIIDDIAINIQNTKSSATANEHQIDLSVKNEKQSADIQIKTIQKNTQWLSTLTAGIINLPELQLSLIKPFDIVRKNDNLLVSPHCWKLTTPDDNNTGNFCVKNLDIGKKGEADLALDSYLLANLDPFLPREFNMAGALSAHALIKWNETEKPNFDVNVFAEDLLVNFNTHKTKEGVVTYPVETFNIKLFGSEESSELSAIIHSTNLLDAKIQGRLFPGTITPEVNALVDIELPDLSPFAVLIPKLENLAGHLKTELTINGPQHKPIINGQINIQDTSVTAVGAPVQINRLNTVIAIKNNIATIGGEFYTTEFKEPKIKKTIIRDAVSHVDKTIKTVGSTNKKAPVVDKSIPGRANIQGTLDWRNKLQGDIHFFANKVAVNDYEKINLLVSPDVHLSIDEHLKLNGDIAVNKGTITVKELSEDAISLSKDVIVVDIESQKDAATLPITINLKVDLGQRLKVQALGLNTTVKGNFRIRKTIEKSPTIHGELNLIDGSYTAFGQQLLLQKSRIIFQGPVNTPYISIEAIRDPNKTADNVTAGVRVTGAPDELELVVFSDPAMAQQEALSYILSGKSLQNSSDSQGNSQITSMLINLSAKTSAPVLSKIGSEVGIEDLSLTASGSGDEESVGISGYIAPGVELSYGVGVFDNFSIFSIRYEMFERFYIEASNGLSQAIDAYYEFDWE